MGETAAAISAFIPKQPRREPEVSSLLSVEIQPKARGRAAVVVVIPTSHML